MLDELEYHFDMQLSQEIGLIPEEPNYVNPFRAAAKVGWKREKRVGDGEEYIERPVDKQQVCERRGSGEGRVKGTTWGETGRDWEGQGGEGEAFGAYTYSSLASPPLQKILCCKTISNMSAPLW